MVIRRLLCPCPRRVACPRTVYKNLAIFWQDYFLGSGKIFLEGGKIFLEMARFILGVMLMLKNSSQFLKKSCQTILKKNLAKSSLKNILPNLILNNFFTYKILSHRNHGSE